MRRRVTLALAAAALVAGCGQDDPGLIPAQRSDSLIAAVDRIEAACADGDEQEAQAAVDDAAAQVNELPRRVDGQLKDNMRNWLEQIQGRLERDCAPEETPTPTPTEEPAETPTPTAEPTETPTPTPTETPEPEPTPEPTEVPPVEPLPDDEGGVPAPDLPEEGDG